MTYGAAFCEGAPEIIVPADEKTAENKTVVPADTLRQLHNKNRKNLTDKLTESEEIAVWEGVGKTIFPAAKAGLIKAKTALVKTGKSLSAATTSGITAAAKNFKITAAAKNFKNNFSGFKLPKGEVPNTSEKK
jgi:hypothetical protein